MDKTPTRRAMLQLALGVIVVGLMAVLAGSGGTPAFSATHELRLSLSADRSGSVPLDGQTVTGNIYVFTSPSSGYPRVDFFIDNPGATGAPFFTEKKGPWDLAGTASNGDANPFNALSLPDGPHSITAKIFVPGTAAIITSNFTVSSQVAEIVLSSDAAAFTLREGEIASSTVSVGTSDEVVTGFALTGQATWLTVTPSGNETPADLQLDINTAGLTPGNYSVNLVVTSEGYLAATLAVTLTVQVRYDILVSTQPNRSAPTMLDGQSVTGAMYVFTSPTQGVSRVDFYYDNPEMTGAPSKTESASPYDFAGTLGNGTAAPFNTNTQTPGVHTITARVVFPNATSQVLTSTFTIGSVTVPAILFSAETLTFSGTVGGSAPADQAVTIASSDDLPANYTLESDKPWVGFNAATGSTPGSVTITVNQADLSTGTNTAIVTVSAPGYTSDTLNISFAVTQTLALTISSSADRANATPLGGQTVSGGIYVFTSPDAGVSKVLFYIDNTAMIGTPTRTELQAPFDLGGTAFDLTATPYNTSAITDGPHTLTASVTFTGGAQVILSADFMVLNTSPAFAFSSSLVEVSGEEGALIEDQVLNLTTTDGVPSAYTITDNAPWLTVSSASGSTPAGLTLSFDHTQLSSGINNATVTATGPGHSSATSTVRVTIGATGGYSLLFSSWPDRFDPSPLDGETVSGNIYAFTGPDTNVVRVRFFLNDPPPFGAPVRSESSAPFDFAGGTVSAANAYNTGNLPDGAVTLAAELDLIDGSTVTVSASFTALNGPGGLSFDPTALQFTAAEGGAATSQPVQLSSASGSTTFTIAENASWLTVSPASGATTPASLTFTADPTGLAAGAYSTTVTASSPTLPPGSITVTLNVGGQGGAYNLLVSLAPNRSNPSLLAGQTVPAEIYVFVSPASSVSQVKFWVDNPAMSGVPTQQENTGPWDLAGGTAAAALPYNTAQLIDGPHTIHAQVNVSGSGTQIISGSFVSDNGCNPIACSEIRVSLPYTLEFDQDHGKVPAGNGIGTGFTYIDPTSTGSGYVPANIATGGGAMNLTTAAGIRINDARALENALSVGIDAPSQVTTVTTSIIDLPAGSGNGESAGLWFGIDQNNYLAVYAISTPSGIVIENILEVEGVIEDTASSPAPGAANANLVFSLRADPPSQTIQASWGVDDGPTNPLGTFDVPSEFFSFDGAGINPVIGTRSFGGIFATHDEATSPLTYQFERFSVTGEPLPSTVTGEFNFSETSYPITFPTSMAYGPDGKLYVTEMFGLIHRLTLDANQNLVQDQVISTLTDSFGAARLTLGITIDPLSTPDNVIVWVSSSNGSVNSGQPNTSTVSKLTGDNLQNIQHVITGLPRAIANHAINSIHFGPDGKLYIAMGGNTGAGAPNSATTEFGQMQEQPLSAAILVADVRTAGFDGSCNNTSDIFGPPPCDVVTYGTGLRNSYDFVWHSTGQMFATDNGLGVAGTYPPSPTPPCLGLASTSQHNPGTQNDFLYKVNQGRYYGHPNPYRNECVFKDGSKQGVPPLPNYEGPFVDLGAHKSANGIIEYAANAFCGALKGDLLIANYSSGDNITRVDLSADGSTSLGSSGLVGGFNNPLPLAQAPDGTIFVGEHGGNKVTALRPLDQGCWTTKAPVPALILDAGSAALNGKLYMVGGKNSSTHLSTLYIYDPALNSWSSGPNMPGTGVENPAVAAYDGKLYVFGGSTAPFGGAVTAAYVYTPGGSWQSLPPLSVGRGGATAQPVNGKIYVIGGMDASGASLASVEVFDPATNGWSTAASMGTRRDNPGSAVLNGDIYVFGGRTRDSDGSTPAATLNSVERYDPETNTWLARAPMPTGRRTMAVGNINGKAQVMGGEATGSGGTFPQNEEYDPISNTWRSLLNMPTPRHGAAFGAINDVVYVAGGGPTAGSAFTNVVEAFSY